MVTNWKSWCRLCAREDLANTHITIELQKELESAYLDAISKHFLIDINLKDWPQNICKQCHEYVKEFISFAHKASRVQTMFAELLSNNDEVDLEDLRLKYDLGDIKIDIPDPSSCIGGFEFIGEEMVTINHVKTEQTEEDQDWEPEHEEDSSNDEDDNDGNDENFTVNTKCEEKQEKKDSEEKQSIQKRNTRRKTFTCTICQKELSAHSKLRNHMLKIHKVDAEPAPTHKITTCPYCNKELRKNKLGGHIRESHPGTKPFVCDDCGKAYTTFGNLKTHKLTHSEESSFKCRYCEKGFKNKPQLKTHEDTHNETNYICTSCGLQLNTRRTLKMHMLVHSDQKPHKCDFCGNVYKRSKELKNHLILHTGLKPFSCNFCDKTFANASNCRSHKKKSHPIELAAMEAAGTKVYSSNIPKLEELRAVTSSKSALIQESGGSIARLSNIPKLN